MRDNQQKNEQKHCSCGADCLSCWAEKLSAACGCKMEAKQYENTRAISLAAGVLSPTFGFSIRPKWATLLMSSDSVAITVNTVLLKRVESKLRV